MKNALIIIISFYLFVLISGCSKSGIKIDGVVRDGLNGIPVEEAKVSFKNTGISSTTDEKGYFSLTIPLTELEGIEVKVIDSIQYFISDFDEPAPFLVAQKIGFQDLKYPLNLRTYDLALNILPEPI